MLYKNDYNISFINVITDSCVKHSSLSILLIFTEIVASFSILKIDLPVIFYQLISYKMGFLKKKKHALLYNLHCLV